jgi:hypothetical protein
VYNPDSLSIAHGNLPLYQPMDHHQIVRENLRAWKPLIFKISRATKKEQLIPNFINTQATHEHISNIPFRGPAKVSSRSAVLSEFAMLRYIFHCEAAAFPPDYDFFFCSQAQLSAFNKYSY